MLSIFAKSACFYVFRSIINSMKLTYNNSETVKENVREETGEARTALKELTKFKNFIEKSKELMREGFTCLFVGAAVTFFSCSGANKTNEDSQDDKIEEVEEIEDVLDTQDSTDDKTEEDLINEADDRLFDAEIETIEEEISDLDAKEENDETADEEVPLECQTPVEYTPPTINPVFREESVETTSTTGGEISFDANLNMSLSPSGTIKECPSGNGGYRFMCAGDTETIQGEYYLEAGETNWSARIDAPSETDVMCPSATGDYPLLTYTGFSSRSIKNVTYVLADSREIASIGEFWIDEPSDMYFLVNSIRNEVTTLIFNPTETGTYALTFNKGASIIGVHAKAFDGHGNERTDDLNATIGSGSSRPYYILVIDSNMRPEYDFIDNIADFENYGRSQYGVTGCLRCVGGIRHFDWIIQLPIECYTENDCGCLGKDVNVRIENARVAYISPPHIAGSISVTLPTINITTLTSPTDDPKITTAIDYTPPSDVSEIQVTIRFNIIVEGTTGHACGTGTTFSSLHEYDLIYSDPDRWDYPTVCRCTFGG